MTVIEDEIMGFVKKGQIRQALMKLFRNSTKTILKLMVLIRIVKYNKE